ncbi:hypothetical protein [Wolbachia endosymbiont (group A) of Tiphia femorata]|uniref:hypothetical protein n=1 Tax=Wolbachia endosymbiont (group A) of Tiphia femorata TaxID=2954063 RepID=UPI0022300189|nr:hypothetical protein [Wolbachia endosymbiont (group A) of Tiphia femorata]
MSRCHPSASMMSSQCPDTGSLYNGSAPFLSSQRLFLCHTSSPFFVIPVPRHWDPASFFLDPSVSYSDDTLLNRHTAIHSRYLKA